MVGYIFGYQTKLGITKTLCSLIQTPEKVIENMSGNVAN